MAIYRIHATRLDKMDPDTHTVKETKEETLVDAQTMAGAASLIEEDDRYEIEAIVRVGHVVLTQTKTLAKKGGGE